MTDVIKNNYYYSKNFDGGLSSLIKDLQEIEAELGDITVSVFEQESNNTVSPVTYLDVCFGGERLTPHDIEPTLTLMSNFTIDEQ